jgi:hypothetical protein
MFARRTLVEMMFRNLDAIFWLDSFHQISSVLPAALKR